jgi:hypothetical protein
MIKVWIPGDLFIHKQPVGTPGKRMETWAVSAIKFKYISSCLKDADWIILYYEWFCAVGADFYRHSIK